MLYLLKYNEIKTVRRETHILSIQCGCARLINPVSFLLCLAFESVLLLPHMQQQQQLCTHQVDFPRSTQVKNGIVFIHGVIYFIRLIYLQSPR